MIRLMLFVGMGGFLGSILRYLLNYFFSRSLTGYVGFGTLIINVIGCFLLGILVHSAAKMDRDWFLFLTTGLCGGFTTFSTFGIENTNYLLNGQINEAMINISLSLILGLGATFLGWYFGEIIFA